LTKNSGHGMWNPQLFLSRIWNFLRSGRRSSKESL
jgi:hypothetical protein